MRTTALDGKKNQTLAEIFLWWFILAVFAAAALLLPASRAGAQTAGPGPLPTATPSDQPPPSPKSTSPAQIGGKPNLSGTWTLNKDESDDPREAIQQAGNSGGRVGMGGGGMGGGGGRRGGQNGSGNAMNNLSQLTIEQTDLSAKVTGDSGEVLALYSAEDSSKANSSPAGSSASPSAGSTSSGSNDPSDAAPAARWQGAQLVAVTPGRRQGSTTRTYELSPDGKQLYVTAKIDSSRFKNPVTFRLVYDRAPSGG
ncbi:MAG TPA: hypothetical protein VNV41_08775 [Candidatus Acidoferrales bacterium]|jgi:hypothetical protein|nr:hypothetical protein [Candidatus Acidoferrales bacterium]